MLQGPKMFDVVHIFKHLLYFLVALKDCKLKTV